MTLPMTKIPEKYLDLFQKRAFAHLATLMADGSPQVTPVWIDFDGTYLLVNSAAGRVKDENMRRDARVAIEIMDPDDPYRYFQVRGRVVEITNQGASDHIDKMAKKYKDLDHYPYRRPDEVRMLYKVLPESVSE
jgi:PPOX class probable F420-dependent enzyme